jgi:uncharacterized membrane protein
MLLEQLSAAPRADAGLLLIVCFIVTALLFGIPAILKKSIKGVVLALFLSAIATGGTYLLAF